MSQTTYFLNVCPTCGRKLQVRLEYLGREMMCNHCGADFIASDAITTPEPEESGDAIIDRIDQLLDDEHNPSKPR